MWNIGWAEEGEAGFRDSCDRDCDVREAVVGWLILFIWKFLYTLLTSSLAETFIWSLDHVQ